MGLNIVYETSSLGDSHDNVVDIVTIHGLHQGAENSWTDAQSGIVWLRDLLPADGLPRRVLNFEYTANISGLLERDPANSILQTAHTLVAELHATRELTQTLQRPIIFICHDLGGVVVKKALAFSARQVSQKVEHKYSIYISTYAIIFLGTPHEGYTLRAWKWMTDKHYKSPKSRFKLTTNISDFKETLQNITDEFAPLAKQFNIYFFWESRQSHLGHSKDYVVAQDSAAPSWDNTERCGIPVSHWELCTFDNEASPGFATIKAALKRYARECHHTIQLRWQLAEKFLETQRSIGASELVGFDIHQNNKPFTYLNSPKYERRPEKVENKYYYVPHNVSSIYTGWQSVTEYIQDSLLKPQETLEPETRKIFVLYGLGGSGKTQLCLKFVHDNRESFYGIFWIDASRNENAERALAQIGRLGGLGDSYQAGIYWLTTLSLPWLLIVDNADDPKTDYSRYFPDGRKGHIILTSRLQACKVHATVGSQEFRRMNDDDAMTLLLRAAGLNALSTENDRKFAKEIAKSLGNLPLALTQAGASIRQGICYLHEYLDIYALHKGEMMDHRNVQGTDQYQHTVYTTWEVSVGWIQKSGTAVATDAMDLLQTMAFLHFEQVPIALFHNAWLNMRKARAYEATRYSRLQVLLSGINNMMQNFLKGIHQDVRKQGHLPNVISSQQEEWDLLRFRRALTILVDHSLIYGDLGKDTYSMHPMVHLWSRERLGSEQQRVWSDFAVETIASSVMSKANATTRNYRRSLIPHLDACLQQQHPQATFHNKQNEHTLAIAGKFGTIYAENGEWRKAESLQRRVIGAREKLLGQSHPDTLDAMFELADGYWNLFRVSDALSLYKSIAHHSEEAYGRQDRRSLKATDNLAKTLWLAGKPDEAQRLSEIAVRQMTEYLGEGHPDTLTAMLNLARSNVHTGRPKTAVDMMEFVLTQRRKMLGDSHLDTLSAFQELGVAYYSQRKLDKAETLIDRVVRERSRILGSQHAYTLWAINDLAKVYTDQGRPQESERLLTDMLDVVTQTLGPEHVGMLMTKHNLARAYNGQGKWAEGKATLLELARIQERTQPPMHPDRLVARLELARTQKHLGDVVQAEQELLVIIEDMTKVLGYNHPKTRLAVGQLSAIYICTGRLDEAEVLDRRLRSVKTDELLMM